MPQRKAIPRTPSPQLQGDDSWVEITYPTVKEARNNKREIDALQRQLEAKRNNGATPEEVDAFEDALEQRSYELMARFIRRWNWVDDDGNPLAQPADNPSVFGELLAQEMKWLGEQIGSGSVVSDEKKVSGKKT